MYITHFNISTPLSSLFFFSLPLIPSSSQPIPFLIPFFMYFFAKLTVFIIVTHRIMGKVLSKGAWVITNDYTTEDIFKGLKLYEHILISKQSINPQCFSELSFWLQGETMSKWESPEYLWPMTRSCQTETRVMTPKGDPSFTLKNSSPCLKIFLDQGGFWNTMQLNLEMTVSRSFTLQTESGVGTQDACWAKRISLRNSSGK